ncbi:pseudouridine synthase [Mycoplasmopsis gallinarum]|uniref:Pseudouridine synthase n=1 Tax=Mycoplasmopsis gallinarum TaxID=29557 RepID=A0A168RPS3_9BACT|nr:pseudouridine synthase [Mycoplasmopsis gallinarum]OAB49175.1 Ribosomal small subunit pseudouridine synthase A [Mycoplasmopsis gallinarum]
MKIEKVISNFSPYSRSKAKNLIKKSQVKVNNLIIDKSVDFDLNKDILEIKNQHFFTCEKLYLVMNKPKNIVCSHNQNEGQTIYDLIPSKYKYIKDLQTFGRLDKDTTGLIIISNDGNLNHLLMSNKKHIEKTYLATLDKPFNSADLIKLNQGLEIAKNEITKPAKAHIINSNLIELTITEGKYHQIKRMFQVLNYKVVELKRIKLNNLILNGLELGQVKEINVENLLK